MRVIADHARAAAFLISDGVLPSNEWRGYVLRRIMRRGMSYGRQLGLTEPFLWQVAGSVADLMGGVYPELVEQRSRVAELVKLEEERFAEVLDRAPEKIAELDKRGVLFLPGPERVVSGDALFTLHDTYGLPPDQAEDILKVQPGVVVDATTRAGYEKAMEAQRERARAAATFGAVADEESQKVYQTLAGELPKPQFVGFEALASPARILAMVAGGGGAGRPWPATRSSCSSTARRSTRSRAARSATPARSAAARAGATSWTRSSAGRGSSSTGCG